MKVQGFEPFFDANSRILVLGSFPSVKSRECNFYYGHPQNRFWRTAAQCFGCPTPVSVPEKQAFARKNGLALWDIVTECEIVGSQDSTITDYSVADVASLVRSTDIRRILLNGKTAGKIFADNFPELVSLSVQLPSTSPANPRFDAEKWRKAFDLNGPV